MAKIRAAVAADVPAMGRVMVESWLTAHQGQMPAEAYRRRVDEWTPEVSARGWARVLANDEAREGVLLVAEDGDGDLVGLVYGVPADGDIGPVAQVAALYVATDRQRRGTGGRLLQAAARGMADLGYSMLQVGVLTANQPARRFYEAMGGVAIGRRSFDEDGYPLAETVYAWPDIAEVGPGSTRV